MSVTPDDSLCSVRSTRVHN